MAGNNNFTEPQNFEEAWRRQEKRQQRQERRTPGASGAIVSNEGLAERVFTGSQPPAASSAFLFPDSDWAIEAQEGISIQQSYGSLVQWYVRVSRIGAAITVGVSGNIANTVIGTLSAGWVPIIAQPSNNGGAGRLASFVIDTDALVYITAVAPAAGDITTGEEFGFGAFYIATPAVQ